MYQDRKNRTATQERADNRDNIAVNKQQIKELKIAISVLIVFIIALALTLGMTYHSEEECSDKLFKTLTGKNGPSKEELHSSKFDGSLFREEG